MVKLPRPFTLCLSCIRSYGLTRPRAVLNADIQQRSPRRLGLGAQSQRLPERIRSALVFAKTQSRLSEVVERCRVVGDTPGEVRKSMLGLYELIAVPQEVTQPLQRFRALG